MREQAPLVAENVVAALDGRAPSAVCGGHGSCPRTAERGRIVLAEFGYGGALKPSFPNWLIDGTKATRPALFLKEKLLPPVYRHVMPKGGERLAAPTIVPAAPTPHEAQDACGVAAPAPAAPKAKRSVPAR